jgi:hypothetical protein
MHKKTERNLKHFKAIKMLRTTELRANTLPHVGVQVD